MKSTTQDLQILEDIFEQFYPVGATSLGGVTRLGYSPEEDEMHAIFRQIAEEEGFQTYVDEVGNTYAANEAGSPSANCEYYLIGSHLDSVVDGGRYDGVAGIIAGLMVMKWLKEQSIQLPLRVVAFRCEESSNFGRCTIGSGLITKRIGKPQVECLIAKDGSSFAQIFKERGLSMDPKRIADVKQYLELHIEQGKVLEEYGMKVGIVTNIAGPRRFNVHIHGEAEHSGATPMNMRSDALCAAAEFILEVERIGKDESHRDSVATVGVIDARPNVLNVTPGEVTLGVDLRGIDDDSLELMEKRMREATRYISAKRHIPFFVEKTSAATPIELDRGMQKKLIECAERLRVTYKVMPSGAGHDAMAFAEITRAAMVFIPCCKGVSHNRGEFTSLESIYDGARVIYEYLKEEGKSYDSGEKREGDRPEDKAG